VFDAVEHVVGWGLEHRTLGQIDAIGVDEIQYAKGHKYLTLVYRIDTGITRLLWVGRERTTESFQEFFTAMGREVISATTSRPSAPIFSRKRFSSSGTTTRRAGPESSSMSGAAKPCDPASNP
jgi:hypothetical protein